MFGPHLTLDLYNCDAKTMDSQELVFKVLDELPGHIGMHKITAPQLMPYAGKEDSFDKGGISAFVLIAESHITIHTFNEQRHAFIDIFSCKNFDVEKAVAYLTAVFKPESVGRNLIMRGKHFSKDISKVKVVIAKQRGRMPK